MVQILETLRHSLSIIQIPEVSQDRQGFPRPGRILMGGGVGGDKWPHAIADYEIWKALVPPGETSSELIGHAVEVTKYVVPDANANSESSSCSCCNSIHAASSKKWVGNSEPRGTPHTGGGESFEGCDGTEFLKNAE
jgi:hypothetical protein